MDFTKTRRLNDVTATEETVRRFIRSQLNRENSVAENCKACPKALWFTAFFDGTGNNYDLDGNGSLDTGKVTYSNIAKLAWFAHPPKSKSGSHVYSSYIQGVGTPCARAKDTGKDLDGATGMATAAKGQARLDAVLSDLEEAVREHWPYVSQINLAVFGFSRGAALARAFIHLLEKKLGVSTRERLYWKKPNSKGLQPEIKIYFMGLMDTVASTGFGGSRMETTAKVLLGPIYGSIIHSIDEGGHAAWAKDISIPAYVQQCVHFVAGHEVREKFPCDSVRRDREHPGNCFEVVFPGMHSDVGGGYAPATPSSQENRSNELARIPLCHMYLLAYTAGVPFKAPSEVLASAGSLFEISPELERTYQTYMDGAPSQCALEQSIIWHMNRYYEWRESRRRRLNDGRLKPTGGVDPYMKITDEEWENDVLSVAKSATGFVKVNLHDHERAIFDAYKHRLFDGLAPQARADFDLFFDRYVHDSIAGFKKQMTDSSKALGRSELSRWSVNRRIFMGRRGRKSLYWCYEGYSAEASGNQVAALMDTRPEQAA